MSDGHIYLIRLAASRSTSFIPHCIRPFLLTANSPFSSPYHSTPPPPPPPPPSPPSRTGELPASERAKIKGRYNGPFF